MKRPVGISSEMVERGARAMHLMWATTGGDPTWEELPEAARRELRDEVRVILTAALAHEPR